MRIRRAATCMAARILPRGHAARRLVVVRQLPELEGRRPRQAGLEGPALHRAVRHLAGPEADAGGIHDLVAAVVEDRVETVAATLESRHHPRHVVHAHGDADARLDEVALGVLAEVPAEVVQDPGVRDLNVVVESLAVDVDAEVRELPLGRRRGHQNTTLAKVTTAFGSGHWPYCRSAPGAPPVARSSVQIGDSPHTRRRSPSRAASSKKASASPASTAASIRRSSAAMRPSASGETGSASPKRGPTWARSAPATNATRRPLAAAVSSSASRNRATRGSSSGRVPRASASCTNEVSTGTRLTSRRPAKR